MNSKFVAQTLIALIYLALSNACALPVILELAKMAVLAFVSYYFIPFGK